MVEFPNFIFSCPPCCGADWFLQVARSVGLDSWHIGSIHTPCSQPTKYYTSIVRHPYSWLKDFYFSSKNSMIGAILDQNISEIVHYEKEFPSFLRRVSKTEDVVWNIFARHSATTVMRFEDMPYALIEFLDSIIEFEEKENSEMSIPNPPNVGFSGILIDADEKELQSLVLKSEKRFCDSYNYLWP